MREVEIKILDIDKESVIRKLLEYGAEKVFDGEMHALYYDTSDGSLGSKKDVFRLRKEGNKAFLTYKSYIENINAKVRDEAEVEVSDFEKMRLILRATGFSSRLEMRKHRTTYELPGVCFDIDRYDDNYSYIPEFLEIEADNIEVVFHWAGILGFSHEECKPWDILQVADYYSKKGVQH